MRERARWLLLALAASWPFDWRDLLAFVGVAFLYAGTRQIYPPAGLILVGVVAVLVAFRS